MYSDIEQAPIVPIAAERRGVREIVSSMSSNGSSEVHIRSWISKVSFRIPAVLKHLIIVLSFTSFQANATHLIATRTLIDEVTSVALLALSIFAITYWSSSRR